MKAQLLGAGRLGEYQGGLEVGGRVGQSSSKPGRLGGPGCGPSCPSTPPPRSCKPDSFKTPAGRAASPPLLLGPRNSDSWPWPHLGPWHSPDPKQGGAWTSKRSGDGHRQGDGRSGWGRHSPRGVWPSLRCLCVVQAKCQRVKSGGGGGSRPGHPTDAPCPPGGWCSPHTPLGAPGRWPAGSEVLGW